MLIETSAPATASRFRPPQAAGFPTAARRRRAITTTANANPPSINPTVAGSGTASTEMLSKVIVPVP